MFDKTNSGTVLLMFMAWNTYHQIRWFRNLLHSHR